MKILDLSSKKGKKSTRTVKTLLLQVHRYLGVLAALVFFTVCLSGAILVFEKELTPLLYKHEQIVSKKDRKLSTDSLVTIAAEIHKDAILYRMELQDDPSRSVKFLFKTKNEGYRYAYIDPYSGLILSKGKLNDRFFQITLNYHRFLLTEPVGKTITGISCIFTLILAISGIYLWWPNTKRVLTQRLKIKADGSKKRFTWDLHAVGGFYVSIILIIICLTGLVWSYDWVNRQIYLLLDGKMPKKELILNKSKQLGKNDIYSGIVTTINQNLSYRGDITVTFPDTKGKAIWIFKENLESLTPVIDQAYFDSESGDLLSVQPFKDLSSGAKVRRLVKPIHMGSYLGMPTKILFFLAVLFACTLPITGIMVWLNKKKKGKKSKIVPLK